MDVDVSLSTSGLSPHELAANSEGSIYITMQNGKISAALIDLVFADIAGWAWKKTKGRKFDDIDCGVGDYSIEEGVISTEAFILDFESGTIRDKVTGSTGLGSAESVMDFDEMDKNKRTFAMTLAIRKAERNAKERLIPVPRKALVELVKDLIGKVKK